MVIPEYMRFYGQTADQALGEYAKRFFSLVNSMYRIKAEESLDRILTTSVAFGNENGDTILSEYKKQAKGLQGILQEIRIAKKTKNVINKRR